MIVRRTVCVACLVLTAGGLRAEQPDPCPRPTLNETLGQLRVAALRAEAARLNLEATTERAAWAERMVKMKYMSPAQGTAERARLAEAEAAYLEARLKLTSLVGGSKPGK